MINISCSGIIWCFTCVLFCLVPLHYFIHIGNIVTLNKLNLNFFSAKIKSNLLVMQLHSSVYLKFKKTLKSHQLEIFKCPFSNNFFTMIKVHYKGHCFVVLFQRCPVQLVIRPSSVIVTLCRLKIHDIKPCLSAIIQLKMNDKT